jgi:hypothetical protein
MNFLKIKCIETFYIYINTMIFFIFNFFALSSLVDDCYSTYLMKLNKKNTLDPTLAKTLDLFWLFLSIINIMSHIHANIRIQI